MSPEICGGIRASKYSVRCTMCNKDHSALQRLFSKDPSLRVSLNEKFNKDEESRANFISRSRGLLGNDLKALVQTIVSEKTSEQTSTKRQRHVEYLDEPDLKKRFVDRPEQLEKLMSKGPVFEHPETGANMYQLTSFSAEHPYRCNRAIPGFIIGPHAPTMRGLTPCASRMGSEE